MISLMQYMSSRTSQLNPIKKTDVVSDKRSFNLRVRQNFTTEHVTSHLLQTRVSKQATSNPFHIVQSNDSIARVSQKRPIHVSDPFKSIICHTFSPGRTGNHLFEYASILGIAETTGKSFFFTNSDELQRLLKMPPVQKNSSWLHGRCRQAEQVREDHGCQYDRRLISLEPGKDYDIGQYLQSWLYFDAIRDEVREAMTFNDDIVAAATRVVQTLKLRFPNTTLVGVHVRRGDLAVDGSKSRAQGYLTAPPEFFQRATRYFRQRFSRVAFVVLGEDRQWSTEHIPSVDNDVVVLEPNSPAVDMQILSMTDHMIRTVGTFGWWAAFKMAGRPTVVSLKEFVKNNSWISRWYTSNAADFMLPGWLAM